MKYKYILLLFSAFITLSSVSYSMPPHPDVVDQYKRDGKLKTLMNRVESISSRLNKNSPVKAFPAAGVRRVPVLLVSYAEPYDSASAPFLLDGDTGDDNFPAYAFIMTITVFLMLMLKLVSGRKDYALKQLTPVYISLFVFFISCGIDKKEEDNGFPTDSSVYSEFLNGETASVRKYYQDMSRGNLDLEFDIYGPVKVSKTWDYYGENNSDGADLHDADLAAEALRLLVSKYASVDFRIYNHDGDNLIDAVIIVHEGPGEESNAAIEDLIWSSQWDLASSGLGPVNTGDGVAFNVYTMQPEYTFARGDSSMGVFAHEFGHVLGLPDIYDTSRATNGTGDWSLMASGSWKGTGTVNDGTAPAPLLAWERFKAGGSSWVTITELTSADNQVIQNIDTSGEVFKVLLDSTTGAEQYLVLEGKVQSVSGSWYVAGTGVLVTHVHEGVINRFTPLDEVNAGDGRVHGLNILEADGNDLWSKTNPGTAGDLYVAGKSITNAIIYNDNVNYTLSSSASTVDINDFVQTSLSPFSMTFDVVP